MALSRGYLVLTARRDHLANACLSRRLLVCEDAPMTQLQYKTRVVWHRSGRILTIRARRLGRERRRRRGRRGSRPVGAGRAAGRRRAAVLLARQARLLLAATGPRHAGTDQRV